MCTVSLLIKIPNLNRLCSQHSRMWCHNFSWWAGTYTTLCGRGSFWNKSQNKTKKSTNHEPDLYLVSFEFRNVTDPPYESSSVWHNITQYTYIFKYFLQLWTSLWNRNQSWIHMCKQSWCLTFCHFLRQVDRHRNCRDVKGTGHHFSILNYILSES